MIKHTVSNTHILLNDASVDSSDMLMVTFTARHTEDTLKPHEVENVSDTAVSVLWQALASLDTNNEAYHYYGL